MSATKAMAATALKIHDQWGAQAMQRYIYHARELASLRVLWDRNDREQLQDESAVSRTDGQEGQVDFLFEWTDEDGERQSEVRSGTAAPPPEPPELSEPMMTWPNTEAIQQHMLQCAAAEHRRRVNDTTRRPEIEMTAQLLALMDGVAPGARRAANAELRESPAPQDAIDSLDSFIPGYAEDALLRMPPEEWEALISLMGRQEAENRPT